MKIIDLLVKRANREDMPKMIMYNNIVWEFVYPQRDYRSRHNADWFLNDEIDNNWIINHLNTEVEEVEIIEENKKIEKIKIEQDTPSSNFYIRNETGTKCALTKHSKIIADKINELIDEVNKIKEEE